MDFPLREYLARIGVDAAALPAGRVELVDTIASAQHVTIAFENLDIHRGIAAAVEPSVIIARLIDDRRGGICFELNGLLLLALRELGVDAWLVGARVIRPGAGLGPLMGHMAVVAVTDGGRRLVDVGFGGERVSRPYPDDGEVTVEVGDGGYIVEPTRRELADFDAIAWWTSTSPESRFTGSIICTRPDGDGRVTLTDSAGGYRLIRSDGDRRAVLELDEVAARDALSEHFGIEVDCVPAVSGGLRMPGHR